MEVCFEVTPRSNWFDRLWGGINWVPWGFRCDVCLYEQLTLLLGIMGKGLKDRHMSNYGIWKISLLRLT